MTVARVLATVHAEQLRRRIRGAWRSDDPMAGREVAQLVARAVTAELRLRDLRRGDAAVADGAGTRSPAHAPSATRAPTPTQGGRR